MFLRRAELAQAFGGIGRPLEPTDVDVADVVTAQEGERLLRVGCRVDLPHRLAPFDDLLLGVAALFDVMLPPEHGGESRQHRDAAEVLIGSPLRLEDHRRAGDRAAQPEDGAVLARPLFLQVTEAV